jgi:very-short-patch-repair endonuclease
MLVMSRAVGLPNPEINKWLDLHDGEPMIRPDFMWRAHWLIVETDGGKSHRTRPAFEARPPARSARHRRGWRVIRTTEQQIKRRPPELHATVATLLARSGTRGRAPSERRA